MCMKAYPSKSLIPGAFAVFCVFLLLFGVYRFSPKKIESVRSFFPLLSPLTVKMDQAAEELKSGKTIGEAVEAFFCWDRELHETDSH